MRYLLVFCLLLSVPFLSGCSANRHLVAQQQATISELNEELSRLRRDLHETQVQLQDYDDAVSGVMHRQVRSLREQIAKLEYELAGPREGAQGETVEILPVDAIFQSGRAELTPQGIQRLSALATQLEQNFSGRMIRVEGHTDSVPIGPGLRNTFASNWELSAARAAAVARHLQSAHNIDGSRLEVVGYGPYRPVQTNNTPQGRQANRRVRVAVL